MVGFDELLHKWGESNEKWDLDFYTLIGTSLELTFVNYTIIDTNP